MFNCKRRRNGCSVLALGQHDFLLRDMIGIKMIISTNRYKYIVNCGYLFLTM